MKKILSSIFGLMFLALTFNVILPQTILAQAQTQEELRLQFVMNPDTDPEVFRQEMINYLSEMENAMRIFESYPAVRAQYEKSGMNPVAALAQARADLAKVTPEDLSKMRAVYAKFPGWREAPRVLTEIANPESGGKSKLQRVANSLKGDVTTNVITPDACPTIEETPSFADIAITEGFLIAADAAMEAFPTDGITFLARLPSIATRAGLKAAVVAENTLRSQYDDCHSLSLEEVEGAIDGAKTEIINNDNSNKNAIVNNDNSNTTTITQAVSNAQTSINNTANSNTTALTTAVDNAKTEIINNATTNTTAINLNVTNSKNEIVSNATANTTSIINNDNSNRTQIITNDNSNTAALNLAITNAKTEIINNATANKNELRDLLLRSQIEADLSAEPSAVKVAWYMTPTAKGGHLDLVQQIVTQTLANIVAAGGTIGTAQSFLDQANADKAAGRFKQAYDNYRKAYKAAAN